MCGFTGFLSPLPDQHAAARLQDMLTPIVHRGPDDGGRWVGLNGTIALGHRRLSIVDLSPAGHQPMTSASGRFVIIYNGEIYNHKALREQLAAQGGAPAWRGHSDTETLLACISAWGVERTLQASVGMFAAALWDQQEQSLTLFRDRIGEKPLHFGWQGDHFLFGSELKSLRAHPAFRAEIDWDAAGEFLAYSYISAPSTIYRGVSKLPAGTYLVISAQDCQNRHTPAPRAYWSLGEASSKGMTHPFEGSYADAVDELERRVAEAVRLQSVADVPVGAFLSGGVDSSLVTALMAKQTGAQVLTFSIGMPEAALDESAHAAAVAQHLGTTHTAHQFSAREALNLLPRLPEIWDEPFADSSQLPTLLVSALARQQVTVALSGDGGDEFFLGYPKYGYYEGLMKHRRWRHLPWRALFSVAGPVLRDHPALARGKSVVGAWNSADGHELDQFWSHRFRNLPFPARKGKAPRRASLPLPQLRTLAETAALADAHQYLPDDILVKVDRASMAYSLETRAPLLDHRVIELALSLPTAFKHAGGVSKRVLRDVLYRHVPQEIVDRPKMGFSIPLREWLAGDLKDWGASLIDTLAPDHPFLDKETVQRLWREHQAGQNRTEPLWSILTLLSFLQGKP